MEPTLEWQSLGSDDVLRRLRVSPAGLDPSEVEARLSRHGLNELHQQARASPLALLLKQFTNYFIVVLIFAGLLAFAVSFLPGESGRRLTSAFILGIVLLSVALSFFEEYRAQRALDALDRLLVARAWVIRSGRQVEVDASQVVPGDVLVLAQGQKVPADARLLEAHSLRADESALTGESVGSDKDSNPVPAGTPLAEQSSMVFAATFITHGTGQAVIVRTGMETEVGKIASGLEQMAERPTPFQQEVQRMARQMTVLVGGLAAGIAILLLGALHESPIDVALNTVSLAVATIPESLPVVLTFALALGAHQMAVRKAVVRRLAVVESLGSVDTICTDKTGTLTQNALQVERLFVDDELTTLGSIGAGDGNARLLLLAGVLCNEATFDASGQGVLGDPVDVALLRAAESSGIDVAGERLRLRKVNELPFSSERKMMTTIHRASDGFVTYTKGAPEAVLQRSNTWWIHGKAIPLGPHESESLLATVEKLEGEGAYVLGLATKRSKEAAPAEEAERDLTFVGLEVMADPVREEAVRAVAEARQAGIRVVMITGDNSRTAQAVARQLGLGERVMEASALEELSRDTLRERMRAVDIVARATPQIKQRVLQALQDGGHFVAMTGDGVNDSIALRQADVGVAMGQRGTDMARESAAMILLDDNFATITTAIEEGRRIFDNIRKFTNYLLSTSLGEVLVVLALSATGYFPLTAKMLLWVNVVTDLIPASALATDPAVPNVMRRRPRRHDEPILNRALYATILGSVLRTLVAYGLIFWAGLRIGGTDYARSMLFTGIVLHAFTRVMVVRQLDSLTIWSNPALLWSYAAAVGLQLLALYTPLHELFGVIPLGVTAWAILLPIVAGSSLAGVYMTRWILRLVPLWQD